jgi:hypothetical protein
MFLLLTTMYQITLKYVNFILCCDVRYNIHGKTMFGFIFTPICFVGFHLILMLFVLFIYEYYCTTRFPFLIMFVGFNSNTRGVTTEDRIANLSETPF